MLYKHLIKEKNTKNFYQKIYRKDFCLKTIILSVKNQREVKLMSFVSKMIKFTVSNITKKFADIILWYKTGI